MAESIHRVPGFGLDGGLADMTTTESMVSVFAPSSSVRTIPVPACRKSAIASWARSPVNQRLTDPSARESVSEMLVPTFSQSDPDHISNSRVSVLKRPVPASSEPRPDGLCTVVPAAKRTPPAMSKASMPSSVFSELLSWSKSIPMARRSPGDI